MLIGTGIVLLALLGVAFFLPSQSQFGHTKKVRMPAEEVFPHLMDLKKWATWHPQIMHKDAEYSGFSMDAGAWVRWKDALKGEVTLELTETSVNEHVKYEIVYAKTGEKQKGTISLKRDGGNTQLEWSHEGVQPKNLLDKVSGFFAPSTMADMMANGLTNLKKVSES